MKLTIEIDHSTETHQLTNLANAILALRGEIESSKSTSIQTFAVSTAAKNATFEAIEAVNVNAEDDAAKLDTAAIFGGSALARSTAGAETSTTALLQSLEQSPPANVDEPNAQDEDLEDGAEYVDTPSHVKSVRIDKRGLTWDARIHQASKKMLKTNLWALKKNIDPVYVAEIEAEIFAARGAPYVEVAAEARAKAEALRSEAPAAPVAPAAPAAPVVPAAPAVGAFPALMKKVSPLLITETQPNGVITHDTLRQIAASIGLADANGVGNTTMLMHRPDLIPAFEESLEALLLTYGVTLGA